MPPTTAYESPESVASMIDHGREIDAARRKPRKTKRRALHETRTLGVEIERWIEIGVRDAGDMDQRIQRRLSATRSVSMVCGVIGQTR